MKGSEIPPVKFIFETSVNSTQDAIVPIIKENPDKCIFLLSETQTAGRGRKDLDWVSLPGGLWGTFSFPLSHIPTSEQLIFLHYQVALTIRNLLEKHYHIPVMVKWPNDIIYLFPTNPETASQSPKTWKKVAGILIEMISAPERHHVLLGIGINLNNSSINFPPSLQSDVVSVSDVLQRQVHLPKFARAFGNSLRKTIPALFLAPPNSETISKIRSEYMTCLYQFKKTVELENGGEYYCEGISSDGCLILLNDAQKIELTIGEALKIKKIR
ncbi:MAG: biotin--[acetyl-CoA-carboxylase] ligase [Promethearchaeota archaeon]